MCFGGATTILLIITENKLPLGVKLPEHLDANIYGISISLLLFVTISTYHNNKKRDKMEFKIINSATGETKYIPIKSLLNFFHSLRRIW
jgi:hypothetical protein